VKILLHNYIPSCSSVVCFAYQICFTLLQFPSLESSYWAELPPPPSLGCGKHSGRHERWQCSVWVQSEAATHIFVKSVRVDKTAPDFERLQQLLGRCNTGVKMAPSGCHHYALIEMKLHEQPFGFLFKDGGANKATKWRQAAGFLRGEGVASVLLIASNDIPAEVIGRICSWLEISQVAAANLKGGVLPRLWRANAGMHLHV